METAMRFAPVLLLGILVWTFIILGFYGLYQQVNKQFADRVPIERVR